MQQAVLRVAYQGRETLEADLSVHRYKPRGGKEPPRTKLGRRTGDVKQIVQSVFQLKPTSDAPCRSRRGEAKPALGAENLLEGEVLRILSY